MREYITGNIIANHADEDLDKFFQFGTAEQFKSVFYIGGQTFPTKAEVDDNRKIEFRELILKLKPAHIAGYLLINYI